jgi:hypothetical protein
MRYKFLLLGFLACLEAVGLASPLFAAYETRKLKIAYSTLTGAYSPLWIAVEERLGKNMDWILNACI